MHINKVLAASFFNRPVLTVAEDLIGKFLVRKINGYQQALLITEVEAYDGPYDRACHGRFGKTARTVPMFGPAGQWYIYLVYGMHWMLNVVTGAEGYPAAVLIRGASDMAGPARLTKHLSIDKTLNGLQAIPSSGLWFEERDFGGASCGKDAGSYKTKIVRTPRIGIDYAGPVWSKKPYRFVLAPH